MSAAINGPSSTIFAHLLTNRIAEFLTSIGIPVVGEDVPQETFLPGIRIKDGVLLVDESRLTWPGDLLHEAAHIAMTPASERANLGDDATDDGGEEIGALAWSWAAICHLDMPPEVVFHEGGYRGGSGAIIENFREGRFIGVPFLRWIGLTDDRFPRMIRWLRD